MQRPFPAYTGNESFVFASYAHKDADRVYPLLLKLHNAGIRVWYDEGIHPGSRWRDELAHAIEGCASLIYFVSPLSVASANCSKEVSYALDKGKRVAVVYLEQAQLPQGLEFSLSDEQAVHASHYDSDVFNSKLQTLVEATSTGMAPTRAAARQMAATTLSPKARYLAIATLCLLLAAVLVVQWWGNRQPESTGPPVVAIAEFRNLSGEETNSWLGDGLAHLVRDKLSLSRHVQVVSDVRWSGLKLDAADADLMTTAKQAGIGFVVSGEILSGPTGLVLSARMTQLESGVDVAARSFRDLTAATLINKANQLALAVKQSLKIPSEAQVDSLAADFQVENLSAYESYVAGLQFYNAFAYDKAEAAMQTALQLEPSYAMAAYRAANIQASAGRLADARRTLESLPENQIKTPREDAYIQGLTALLAEDNAKAIEIYQQILLEYPYEIEAQQFLAEAYYRDYQDDKGIEVLRVLAQQEPENLHVWLSLGFMLSSVEKLDEARAALTRYQELAPLQPNPWELLGSLEMKAGNGPLAEAHFGKAIQLDPNFSRAQQGQARLEILRGDFGAAQPRLETIINDESKPPRDRVEAAVDLVALFQATAQYALVPTTLAKVEPLLEEWVTLARSEEGLAALRRGDGMQAELHFRDALSYQFPGYRPTRFLFCLGLAQAAANDTESLRATLLQLSNLPADDAGGKLVEKAIAYLLGLDALKNADYPKALDQFRIAAEATGFEYRIYRIGLAETLYRMGKLDEALVEAERAGRSALASWAGEPRLDLEVDRRLAQALAINILQAQGRGSAAADREQQFRLRWGIAPKLTSVLFDLESG